MADNRDNLTGFGFSFDRGGTHLARSMMLTELGALLGCVQLPGTGKDEYHAAICDDNRLGKRSAQTRRLTYRHLASLYSLDPSVVLFRALRTFWERDPAGRPLLALLCACARDSVLRSTAPFVLSQAEGTTVSREDFETFIEAGEPGRFSKATRKSTAQNISTTWTRSGHLRGHLQKVRSRAVATAGSVSYALLLGFLAGVRGRALFRDDYARLLDCVPEDAVGLAEEASRRGWIVLNRVGEVIEVLFPNLLTAEEMRGVR